MSLRNNALAIGSGALIGAGAILIPVLQGYEGLVLKAEPDPVGIPTICYGHTEGVRLGDSMSKQECDYLLAIEVMDYMKAVDFMVTVDMPETRLAALSSFAYNVGTENLRKSTLLKLLNAGHTREACNELKRWVYAKGKKLRGLAIRREDERKMCLEGLEDKP